MDFGGLFFLRYPPTGKFVCGRSAVGIRVGSNWSKYLPNLVGTHSLTNCDPEILPPLSLDPPRTFCRCRFCSPEESTDPFNPSSYYVHLPAVSSRRTFLLIEQPGGLPVEYQVSA